MWAVLWLSTKNISYVGSLDQWHYKKYEKVSIFDCYNITDCQFYYSKLLPPLGKYFSFLCTQFQFFHSWFEKCFCWLACYSPLHDQWIRLVHSQKYISICIFGNACNGMTYPILHDISPWLFNCLLAYNIINDVGQRQMATLTDKWYKEVSQRSTTESSSEEDLFPASDRQPLVNHDDL